MLIMKKTALENAGPTTQVTTGRAVLSFCHLFEPKGYMDGAPKYSTDFLIPKTDTATMYRIKQALGAAVKKYEDASPARPLPPAIKVTMGDGDGTKESGVAYPPECAGHFVLTARSKERPLVVDDKQKPIEDPAQIWGGCSVYGIVDFYAYAVGIAIGITAQLRAVMLLEKGLMLGGPKPITAEDWIVDDTPPTPKDGWDALINNATTKGATLFD